MLKYHINAKVPYIIREEKIDHIHTTSTHSWVVGNNLLYNDKEGGLLYCKTLYRRNERVYIVNEGTNECPEFCAFSKSRASLERFMKDFNITAGILKDDMVIQTLW